MTVACEFLELTDDSAAISIELVSPTRDDAVINDRLRIVGPGLYHIALEVDELNAESARTTSSPRAPARGLS
jgi:methylmalonyl-CoA/ethylmalonyl-CoA epimerase